MDMQNDDTCDLNQPPIEAAPHTNVKEKKMEVIDGYTIKYHANGKTRWSKGKMANGKPDGYWEWYRPDGTIKRSGHFNMSVPIGEWTTYDEKGRPYKTSNRDNE